MSPEERALAVSGKAWRLRALTAEAQVRLLTRALQSIERNGVLCGHALVARTALRSLGEVDEDADLAAEDR
jgi:molybdenum cofactor biosynthesis enzyme